MSDEAKPFTLEQVWAHAKEAWDLANHRTRQWRVSDAEVTRLREELAQAKLDIAEARELIASYDRDTRQLREELAAARFQLEEARGLLERCRFTYFDETCAQTHDHDFDKACNVCGRPIDNPADDVRAFLAPAPAPTCATCGVTGGDGFLITNDDGTPCLDRPCPTCSRSVNP